jgi:hypothetical protein
MSSAGTVSGFELGIAGVVTAEIARISANA